MRAIVLLVTVVAVAVAGLPSEALAACREYTLIDNDTGERVDGCVEISVKSTNTTPVAVVPAMKKKRRFGWKISDLTRGDMFARMGMRPGDVILTMNGYDMASQETPNIIAEILGGNDKLNITVGKKPRSPTATKAAPPTQQATIMEVKQSSKGITLEKIPANSFFETIGLQPGDTVISIAGRAIKDPATLNYMAKEAESMPEVHVVVKREGKELDFLIKAD